MKLLNFSSLLKLVLCFSLLILLYSILSGNLSFGSSSIPNKKYITVIGSAQQDKKNQIATFSATLTSIKEKKADAISDLNIKSKNAIDAVKTFGINDDDVKTNYFNIYQNSVWDQVNQVSKLNDWVATTTIEITLRDTAKSYELSTLLANLDISNVSGPNFALTNDQQNDSDLLVLALKDARSKAEKLALAQGKKLGDLINLVEGTGSDQPGPIMLRADGIGGGGGVASQPGITTLAKNVTATFELKRNYKLPF